MHPALTDDSGGCFLSTYSVLSTVPTVLHALSQSLRVQMWKPRSGKTVPSSRGPTASR